jgi:hypothetical protein
VSPSWQCKPPLLHLHLLPCFLCAQIDSYFKGSAIVVSWLPLQSVGVTWQRHLDTTFNFQSHKTELHLCNHVSKKWLL